MSDPEPPSSSDLSSASSSNSTKKGASIDHEKTSWASWKNWVNAVTRRFDADTLLEYVHIFDDEHEEKDIKRCEKERDYLLKWSPQIIFMQKKIRMLGGDLNKNNIRCMKCRELKGSGFDPDYGIQLCANRAKWRSMTEDCLAHEMIHAYDHLRFKVDWDNNLWHAACTEIRASSLSGECRFGREYWQNPDAKFTAQHQSCVRRRAQLSVMARPNCKDEREAAKVVNDVWESCFADTRPFDEIYK